MSLYYAALRLIKVELGKSLHCRLVPEACQLIFCQHILLGSDVLTPDAVILFLVLIVKHINVQVSHKAGGTSVI